MLSLITFVRREMAGDHGCDAKSSPSGESLGQGLGAEIVVIVCSGQGILAGQGGKGFFHRLQQRPDQAGLKLAGGLGAPAGEFRRHGQAGRDGRRKSGLRSSSNGIHQMTSSSASSAPAALMACRIEITSRAVAPIACRRVTSCSTLAPSLNSTLRAGASPALILVSGTTSVCPEASALGWETAYVVVTSI